MENILSDLYEINIEKLTDMLSKSYITLIKKKIPLKSFPSVMLWGAPGVGKSQGVREIAKKIEAGTKKKVIVTDVRLLLFNPVDLRGIPTSNEDKTLAIWLKPKIFQMDESENVINILFLDEISAAPPSVQAAAYQITLDRTVGEHSLPENCIVMAAGNRVTDKSVAYNMPKALANRLCHFEISEDSEAWHNWAVKKGLHKYVVGYLEYNPVVLMKFDPSGTELAFPSPRSWEMVSNILNTVSDNLSDVFPMIVGCIGKSAANGFRSWVELYTALPPVENIFHGKEIKILQSKELLIALRSAMVEYARKHPEKALIDNSVEISCKLPWTFRGKLMHDYYYMPQIKPIITKNEVFKTALKDSEQQ